MPIPGSGQHEHGYTEIAGDVPQTVPHLDSAERLLEEVTGQLWRCRDDRLDRRARPRHDGWEAPVAPARRFPDRCRLFRQQVWRVERGRLLGIAVDAGKAGRAVVVQFRLVILQEGSGFLGRAPVRIQADLHRAVQHDFDLTIGTIPQIIAHRTPRLHHQDRATTPGRPRPGWDQGGFRIRRMISRVGRPTCAWRRSGRYRRSADCALRGQRAP